MTVQYKEAYMEILIVIDAQNDFITGKLAVPGAEEVVKNICHEVKQTSAFPIVTQDIHDQGEYPAAKPASCKS